MYTLLRFDWNAQVHPRLFYLTLNELRHLGFAISFIFNLLVTVAIATRRFLHLHRKSAIPEGGSFTLDNGKRPGFNKAKILLVDAALPVTLCSFVVMVVYLKTVVYYTETARRVQGVFAMLWLAFSVRALLTRFPDISSNVFYYQEHGSSSDRHPQPAGRGKEIFDEG